MTGRAAPLRLRELLAALPAVRKPACGDVAISGISADSRQVGPGMLFVAIPGVSVDGHRFIPQALERGAVAVVGERAPEDLPLPGGAAARPFEYVQVPDARQAWGWLCAAWAGFPSRRMALVGVTGTDGKTTTVNLIYAILRAAGLQVGMVSTVNARVGGEEFDTGLHTTTPDPPDVQRYLSAMVAAGASHAVLEVTSHGLAQGRVAGCDFDVAAVTNITHEHLDYHGSYEAYRAAKARLFEGLIGGYHKPGLPKTAVLNRDDESFAYLSAIPAEQQLSYSVQGPADFRASDIAFSPRGGAFRLHTPSGEAEIEMPLLGAYNVSNALAAASVAWALGVGLDAMRAGVAAVHAVPGRMERIDEGQDFTAIVDFAHTPNALERFLLTARTLLGPGGRLTVVFGCAGLRDRAKRELMGRVAGQLADRVIITAEDPRTESLEAIMAVTAAAAVSEGKREGVDLWRVPDRGEAIRLACQMARAGDVVAACGKGHEQSMCFGTVEYPWDDRQAMRLALHGQALATLPTAGGAR
jgi:UDP-N-acetylmuramoyl-L-alanyl-D-glutamate--2,6-diaminopimelate ligase